MSLKRGDIVLVPFPFTDLSSHKVRPALIISSDPQGEDILVASISSIQSQRLLPTEFLLETNHPDFSITGLKKNSIFKLKKLLTLHHSTILRRLGSVSEALQNELDQCLGKVVGLSK